MARTIFRISIALLGSFAVIIGESYYLYTCGPGFDYERYRVSYVDPDLLSDSLYQSLYRTLLREHQSGDNYWDTPREEFSLYHEGWKDIATAEGVNDWRRYFGESVPARSVHDLVYEVNDSVIVAAIDMLERRGNLDAVSDTVIDANVWSEWDEPDTLLSGDALRFIGRRHDRSMLDYLHYAKRVESHAWDSAEGWASPDWRERENLIAEGRTAYRAERSSFLRPRYAYQIIRLSRYAKRYRQTVDLYDSLMAGDPEHGPLRYAALSQKAGALRRLGDSVGANHAFAQVFDSAAGRRVRALRDIRLRSDRDWERLYARAANDHERVVIWTIRGLKARSLDFNYMREIAKLDPSSPYLRLALLRELHRIESYLYDDMQTRELSQRTTGAIPVYDYYDEGRRISGYTNITGGTGGSERRIAPFPFWDTLYFYPSSRYDDTIPVTPDLIVSGDEYVASFRRFVLDQAKRDGVVDPALWYMVAGYIDMMDGDYNLADECLGEARDAVGGNVDLRRQIRLLEYLRTRMKGGSDDATTGEQIVETLRWMEEKQRGNRHSKYDKTMAALGRDYLRRDDVPRAILAFNRAHDETARNLLLDMYATDDDLNTLLIMMRSKRYMPLDRMLLDSFALSDDDLLDLRATRMMRRGEFAKADEIYRAITPAYWSEESPSGRTACFRFTTDRTVVDTNLPRLVRTGTEETALRMTRKEFAAEIVRLQGMEKMKSAAGDSASLAIANLLYNAPYWGYASTVWNGGWLWGMRFSYFGPSAYPFNLPVVAERMERAQETFLREYGSRAPARRYYAKTMERTKDRELAAFCANMLDLCDKQPQTSFHPRVTIKDQPREGYDLLLTKYRDTRYAKAALSQCSVYQGFAGR